MRFEGFKVFIGKAFGAVDAGDVFKAVDPKREGIDDRFSQDDIGRFETIRVPDTSMRSG